MMQNKLASAQRHVLGVVVNMGWIQTHQNVQLLQLPNKSIPVMGKLTSSADSKPFIY